MKRHALCLTALAALLLSACCNDWEPVPGHLMTSWGKEVDPSSVLAEYPRPGLVRTDAEGQMQWQSLNGLWNYAIVPADAPVPPKWDGRILVPFCVESSLSGVGRTLTGDYALWYEREFSVPKNFSGERLLINFDAVDYQAQVLINGTPAGFHQGGYTRFTVDATPYLVPGRRQTLTLKVLDGTDNDRQPRGKQVLSPEGIWYTAVSGIWQSVWMESVPGNYITGYHAESDISSGSLCISVETASPAGAVEIAVAGVSAVVPSGERATLTIPNPRLWSPDEPNIYDIDITLLEDGKAVDKAKGYTAFRSISVVEDSRGHKRMALNGEPLFQFGPLDQGWWPDGLYTAPSDAALAFDIRKTKDLGFNMIRKHIKVESERWYYWCDVTGILVWQDMPSITDSRFSDWDRFGYNGTDWDAPAAERETYYREWGEIIDMLRDHPCIAVWVPFNENWGQFETEKVVAFTREHDSTRLVNPASGGNFVKGCGDILDVHYYPDPQIPLWSADQVTVLGEYGGIACRIPGHMWQEDSWGYIDRSDGAAALAQYREYAETLKGLVGEGAAAAVYTQITDVEGEVNGLMTYDRAVVKMSEGALGDVNRSVIASMSRSE